MKPGVNRPLNVLLGLTLLGGSLVIGIAVGNYALGALLSLPAMYGFILAGSSLWPWSPD